MDAAILQDLHTKLHSEQKRITSKSLAIEQSIPRSKAEFLLEALPYHDTSQDFDYEITRCIFEKQGDKFCKFPFSFAVNTNAVVMSRF